MTRAPLRFLLAVLVLWTGVRAALLLPGGPGELAPIPATAAESRTRAPAPATPLWSLIAAAPFQDFSNPLPVTGPRIWPEIRRPSDGAPALRPAAGSTVSSPLPVPAPPVALEATAPTLAPPARPAQSRDRHWSLSAWLLVRAEGGGSSLAPAGTLGGSQAGARLTYALGHGLGLSARAYLPVRNAAGSEAAAGIDWRPVRAIPVNLLAERRQRLGPDGRSAFALTVYGGTSRNLARRLRVDLYAQAGVVGLQSRDMFADGAVRVARRIGPVELGAGIWGAAQPGAQRLDAGPSLSWRLPVRDANLRLQADWRVRIAGEAAPGSGPSLTLAADF